MKGLAVVLLLAGCDRVFGVSFDPDVDASDSVDARPACWDAAVTGDEDLDTKINGCDNCPLLENPNQEDIDSDGVGDLCDPDNTRAHRIAFFDPLERIDNNDWNEAGAQTQWDYAGGGFKQDSNNLGPSLLRYDALRFDEPTLFARVNSATPNPTPPSDIDVVVGGYLVDPGAGVDEAAPLGSVCGTRYDATTQRTWIRVGAAELDEPIPSGMGVARLLRLSMEDSVNRPPTCRILTNDGRDVVVSSETVANSVTMRIALWTSYASAVFSGVFVVTPQ